MKISEKEIQELLKPRFEVIEEYPKCEFKKGEILSPIKYATNPWYHTNNKSTVVGLLLLELQKHPHLFKKLNWWEKRSEEQMPMYLKHTYDLDKSRYSYNKILKWDMKYMNGIINIEKRQVCSLLSWSPEYSYIPISEEEYTENNK
jgi:hypothetical protein